jgi:hypothetical protein
VRIPADVDREDRLLADLTARQVAILAAAAVLLWLAWVATRRLVPPAAFAAAAIPVVAVALMLALGRQDGLSLDRWLAAGLAQARAPRRLVPAPGGVLPPPAWISPAVAGQARPLPTPLRLPADAVTPAGVITLSGGASVALAAASTVNFTLRTSAEQQALTAAFGRTALATGPGGDRSELMANTAAYTGLQWGELTALTRPTPQPGSSRMPKRSSTASTAED